MKRVAVVTDSVACLPPDLIARYGIHVIPVRINIEGVEYRDIGEDLPSSQIRRFQETQVIDTTPWPPEYYFRQYQEISREAREIVHVVAFSQFTSTISLARAGAAMAQSAVAGLRVEVFDSAATTTAQGFVALEACRAAAEGKSLDEVLLVAEKVRDRVSAFFTFDTLRYLARTGRVNRLAGWADSLLNVRPVVGLSHGRERPVALARSKGQSSRKLCELVCSATAHESPLHVAVMESGQRKEDEDLFSAIQRRVHPVESMIVRVSPVTQIVAGPGLLGVAFYSSGE